MTVIVIVYRIRKKKNRAKIHWNSNEFQIEFSFEITHKNDRHWNNKHFKCHCFFFVSCDTISMVHLDRILNLYTVERKKKKTQIRKKKI